MKWFIATVICFRVFLCASAHAETYGSIAYFAWSQNEIAVAADSRQSYSSSYSDTSCKIATFGNKLVFAATGRSSPGLDPSWDAYAVTSKDYERIAGKSTPDHFATRLADAWGKDVKAEFQSLGIGALSGLEDDIIISGLFADFEKDGTLLVAVASVTYQILPTKQAIVKNLTKVIPTTNPKQNGYFLGHSEIINKIGNPQTPEQVEWGKEYRSTAVEWSDKFGRDDTLGGVIGYVDVTIRHLPKIKMDSQGVPFSVVGPPIAALRLIRGKGIEWIAKGKCTPK